MITSLSNERIKVIRKLQERKYRLESGLFYVEGLRAVGAAVETGAPVETLIAAPELLRSEFGLDLLERERSRDVEVMEVSADVFKRLALKEGPQGLAAVVRQRWVSLASLHLGPDDIWVALDSVADPGNLGAILRTSDAVGAKGVILLDQSTDPYDPSSVRASTGAVFTQALVKASFESFQAWKLEAGVPLVGTSGAAPVDYHAFRYPSPLVLLMGSERQGLQANHFKLCDGVVSIPMHSIAADVPGSDSLNLAVATAVTLYEIYNQKRDRGQA